ncbi:shufflon system plasmid conjugative transfer pilus tip adhesin PilV, partial [Enterobacter cloacae]
STGEVLQLDGVNTAGATCSPNGLVSRDASGAILSCQSGVWTGAGKINNSSCKWVSAPNANDDIAGYKTASCPTGWIVQSVRWFQIPSYVDDEHVDAYCCPFS